MVRILHCSPTIESFILFYKLPTLYFPQSTRFNRQSVLLDHPWRGCLTTELKIRDVWLIQPCSRIGQSIKYLRTVNVVKKTVNVINRTVNVVNKTKNIVNKTINVINKTVYVINNTVNVVNRTINVVNKIINEVKCCFKKT